MPQPTAEAELAMFAPQFVARVLTSGMVLQREPASAIVWGHTTPGAAVSTALEGAPSRRLVAIAAPDGTWRQALPPQRASRRERSLRFNSSSGETARLTGVLFGEVYLCAGQSNMAFPLGDDVGAEAAIRQAVRYRTVRLLTLPETGLESRVSPLDLRHRPADPRRSWSRPRAARLATHGLSQFSAGHGFSATCWYFGRKLSRELSSTGEVPVGLIAAAAAWSRLEQWLPQVLRPRACTQSTNCSACVCTCAHLLSPARALAHVWLRRTTT